MTDPSEISRLIPTDLIDPPSKPIRTTVDEEEFLALVDSLRTLGQISPLVVKPAGERYETIAGHRRLMAAKHLRWPSLECRVVNEDEHTNTAVLIHENSFREGVSPEDEGKYFHSLMREKGLSIRDLASMTNRSTYYITSRLATTTWPANIQHALREKQISLGVAQELAKIHDDAERRRLLAYAVDQGCSAKTAKLWAESWEATQQPVDNQNLIAPANLPESTYQEPHYPCYACSQPTRISALSIIRLCGDCAHALSLARNHPQGTTQDCLGNTTDQGASIAREETQQQNRTQSLGDSGRDLAGVRPDNPQNESLGEP